MPTEREVAAGEHAARRVAPGMGGFSARTIARAVLEAAEKARQQDADLVKRAADMIVDDAKRGIPTVPPARDDPAQLRSMIQLITNDEKPA